MKPVKTHLTANDIDALYARNRINHATWINAHRALRGESDTHLGEHAIRTCEQLHRADERFNTDAAQLRAKRDQPCAACRDIDATGISYLDHTCGKPMLAQPTGHNP
jgi:hypothetical protein